MRSSLRDWPLITRHSPLVDPQRSVRGASSFIHKKILRQSQAPVRSLKEGGIDFSLCGFLIRPIAQPQRQQNQPQEARTRCVPPASPRQLRGKADALAVSALKSTPPKKIVLVLTISLDNSSLHATLALVEKCACSIRASHISRRYLPSYQLPSIRIAPKSPSPPEPFPRSIEYIFSWPRNHLRAKRLGEGSLLLYSSIRSPHNSNEMNTSKSVSKHKTSSPME